ncbi:hypothetical protein JW948_05065 [bacterium]|nr:hypothetical protein [bacterium]
MKPSFKILILLIASGCIRIPAAFEPLAAGVHSAGLGGAGFSSPDVFAVLYNPADLSSVPCIMAGSAHTRLFGMKELTLFSFALACRFPAGGLGMGGQSFGFRPYRESVFHLGFGKQLFPRLSAGMSVHLGQVRIKDFGTQTSVWFNSGLIFNLHPRLAMDWIIHNIGHARLPLSGERLPQVTGMGFRFHPVRGVNGFLTLIRDMRFPLEIRSGLEIVPVSRLALRSGMTWEPHSVSFGAGLIMSRLRMDYACASHIILGMTHSVSLNLSRRSVPLIPIFSNTP